MNIQEFEDKIEKLGNDYTFPEFKKDMFSATGMTKHPKREQAFAIAWEYGHSSGYLEVWYKFYALVDLLTGIECC